MDNRMLKAAVHSSLVCAFAGKMRNSKQEVQNMNNITNEELMALIDKATAGDKSSLETGSVLSIWISPPPFPGRRFWK